MNTKNCRNAAVSLREAAVALGVDLTAITADDAGGGLEGVAQATPPRPVPPLDQWPLFRVVELSRSIDGDTHACQFGVDTGYQVVKWAGVVRLLGVNTPESHGATRAAGLAAQQFAEDWLHARMDCSGNGGRWLCLRLRPCAPPGCQSATQWSRPRTDNFGRLLGIFETGPLSQVEDPQIPRQTLQAALLAAGHAKPFMVDQ
jgi:hypothetical protein